MGQHAVTLASREPGARAARPVGTSVADTRAPRSRRNLRSIYAGILVWAGVFGLIWLLD